MQSFKIYITETKTVKILNKELKGEKNGKEDFYNVRSARDRYRHS